MSTAVAIGHYARVPAHVLQADVSSRAKELWAHLALLCSPGKQVWVRQQDFAERLRCCTRTIRRALQELLSAGLIQQGNGWHLGRYKRYLLTWVLGKTVHPPEETMSEDVGQEAPVINTAVKHNIEHSHEAVKNWIPEFKQKFPCLDGQGGRPSIEETIEQALNHKSRSQYKDLKTYLKGWIHNATSRWVNVYKNANTSTPGFFGQAELTKEDYARMNKKREASIKAYEQRQKAMNIWGCMPKDQRPPSWRDLLEGNA